MNNFIFSSVVIGCLMLGNLQAGNPIQTQTYYKNPGYTQFVQAGESFSKGISNTKNSGDRQHLLDMASVFMGQIINSHPEYLDRYAQNFKKMSLYEKAALLRGIRIAGKEHALLKEVSDSKLKNLVQSENLVTLEHLHHLQIKKGDDLDLLWVSFFATGERAYLHQIVEVLNGDEEALFFAYELINRKHNAQLITQLTGKKTPPNTDDLYQYIEKKNRQNPGYKKRVVIMNVALWSLESNAEQDPTIKQVIGEIVKSEPHLDYWKKINKVLGR